MKDRLNIYDKDILEDIETVYRVEMYDAHDKAIEETKTLVESIKFYRTHTIDEVNAEQEKLANLMVSGIDDETALKRGLFEEIEKGYEENYSLSNLTDQARKSKIKDKVNDVLKIIDYDNKKRVIESYKQRVYEDYLKKESDIAFKLHELFNSMTIDEVKKYIDLFKQYRMSANLLEARENAIMTIAIEQNVEVPIFLDDKMCSEAVKKEARKIVSFKDQDGNDKSIKDKAFAKAKLGIEALKENRRLTDMFFAISLASGTLTAMGVLNLSNNMPLSIASWIFTSPVIFASLTAAYTKAGMVDDKASVDEARASGMLERNVDLERSSKNFYDFNNKLMEKYTSLHIEGGHNGLH